MSCPMRSRHMISTVILLSLFLRLPDRIRAFNTKYYTLVRVQYM